MGVIKVSGIVIKEVNFGDYDKMVTILTPNLGKIGCAAKGARRPKSKLMAGTQFLCFGEFVIYKGVNSYSINSVEIKEVFYNLRCDLDKLEFTSKITKIINDVTDENQNLYRIMQLYLNSLYMISNSDKSLDLIYSTFKLRLLSLLGFTPIINKCVNCGEPNKIAGFSIAEDGFKCINCRKIDTSMVMLSNNTIQAIKFIYMAPAKKVFSFNLNLDGIKELNLLSKLYFNNKLEKNYN